MVLFLEYEFDNIKYDIKIGKNAKQNWQIIKEASKNDIWFHLSSVPSCHVILKAIDNIPIPRQVIKHCCILCKSNTNKFKSEKNICVIYSKVQNISLGTYEGEVIVLPKHIKSIII